MKKKLIMIALQTVLWRILLLWGRSLRITTANGEQFDEVKRNGKNYVVAFWHGSMFVGWFVHRPQRPGSVSALVSQSSDGAFLSAVLQRWNYIMIRGSSHIGGKEAMQLMVNEVSNGSALVITPDGPRGPRHEMKMGAVRVAQRTAVPLILAGIAMEKKKYLRSWDRFEVPLPFSSVAVKYSEPITVSQDLGGASLDAFKREMESRLISLNDDAAKMLMTVGGVR